MMNRMPSVMPQLISSFFAEVGYLRSASAFLYAPSSQPFSSVGPILVSTDGPAVPAGNSVVVNDSPDLVRKSFVLSQSVNLDHGPTKMWKLHSRACTVMGLVFANVSR